jgi:Fur family ferric uptake transcriptional regulator
MTRVGKPTSPTLSASTAAAVLPAMARGELRLTAHRRSVLAALEEADRPLATDEVVAAVGVPVSTVYRILAELVDAGVVERVSGATGGDRHELAEEFSRHHHHHLVCTGCGIVVDFEPTRRLERLIEREVAALSDASGFEVSHHLFDMRGRCRECASAAQG